jgi:hypothetical protein
VRSASSHQSVPRSVGDRPSGVLREEDVVVEAAADRDLIEHPLGQLAENIRRQMRVRPLRTRVQRFNCFSGITFAVEARGAVLVSGRG